MVKLLQPRRFYPLKAAWVLAVLGAFYLYTTHRDRPARLWEFRGDTMGSYYAVKVVTHQLNDTGFQQLQLAVQARLDHLNAIMSTWSPTSEVSRFNTTQLTSPQTVSTEIVAIVSAALDLGRRSGGVFDITFSPVFQLWGFGKDGPKHHPSPEALQTVLESCGHSNLLLASATELQKLKPGLQFNLNAIAPGYAADSVARLIRERGLTNIYVDVGGESVAYGLSPRGTPWQIGIETPVLDADLGEQIRKVVRLSDRALATSGDYRNYFRAEDGALYSHIFDPRIARPATSHVASVSVLASNCMTADAMSTTLFVMGPEEGLEWLKTNPGVEALFLLRNQDGSFREVASPGFAAFVSE